MLSFARPRLVRVVVSAGLVAASAGVIAGCGSDERATGGRPVAVATAPQMDSLLHELAGKGVRVETVVPPTADVHELELRPSQVRAMRNAQLIVRPGRENDAWAAEALGQVDGEQVDAAEGLPGDQRHWWMDPTAAEQAARTIAAALDRLDPDGKAARATALRDVIVDLAAIDNATKTCLATVPRDQRTIVTDHDAAGAYAERYGLTVAGTISPGAEPEAAPSAQRVAELEDLMREKNVTAVFPIAPHGSALAKTIADRGGAVLGDPLWADALPGATHDHEAEAGDEHAGHEDEHAAESAAEHEEHAGEEHAGEEHAGEEHAGESEVEPTLESAARLNGAAVAEALGAKASACTALLG